MTPLDAYNVAREYFDAWRNAEWDRLRAVLSPEVYFESPRLGRVYTVDEHIRLYREYVRFPDCRHVSERAATWNPDSAMFLYDVFLTANHDKETVVDYVYVRDGKVLSVFGVGERWPAG